MPTNVKMLKKAKKVYGTKLLTNDQWFTINEIKSFLDKIVKETATPTSFLDMHDQFKILGGFQNKANELQERVNRYYPEDRF